jgi:peroxin-10
MLKYLTVVRANQKDVYYQGYILEHLETMVQSILGISILAHDIADPPGSRWLHSHQAFLKSISDALYLSLTTAIGHRTLGEEYTDIYQISSSSKRKPSTLQRWGYVITETAGWYILIHLWWPQARRRLELKQDEARETGKNGYREKLIRATLAIIENTSSVHLALFYFLGTYYTLPKRLFGIRYVLPLCKVTDGRCLLDDYSPVNNVPDMNY